MIHDRYEWGGDHVCSFFTKNLSLVNQSWRTEHSGSVFFTAGFVREMKVVQIGILNL